MRLDQLLGIYKDSIIADSKKEVRNLEAFDGVRKDALRKVREEILREAIANLEKLRHPFPPERYDALSYAIAELERLRQE